MKAIQIEKPGVINIVDIPYCGDAEAGEVVVKIKTAGICGSDLHIFDGSSGFAIYPNIMGHELAGEIHDVGSGVEDLKKGDRVAVNNVLSCGKCYACRKGRSNVCKEVKVLGVHTSGGFQEYLRISAKNIYKLPDTLSWEHAALIEPYSIASQSLMRGRIEDGDTVLICGAGPIGLMVLQAAKLHNVKVAILDIVESRLEIAKNLGADLIINAKTMDAEKEIKDFTDGEGASLLFEATGNTKVLELCISKYASQAARLVLLGFSSNPASIPPIEIMRRELEVIGTRLNNGRMPEAINWLAEGKIDPQPMITAVYPFEKTLEAFKFVSENAEKTCKVLLEF